jgi:RNA polymerase sigma-70 factor (ECF subfamily)
MAQAGQDSDELLMARIARGDHGAFATLVRRHTDKFYATAYRICGRRDEAEDILQDAFLKLWDRPGLYDESRGAKFTTWFYRVVTNQALDRMRKVKPMQGGDALDSLSDHAPRQDDALAASEEQKAVETAIQSLPERQKTALNLCFYEGLSNKEAADIMGVGIKALESLLIRAKTGLRDELTRQGFIKREREYG